MEAFPWDTAPRYLLRGRDGVYGDWFRRRRQKHGHRRSAHAPHSSRQNAQIERCMRSMKAECLDHMIFFGEKSLCRALTEFEDEYLN